MTTREFENKYRDKGGILKLTELRAFFYSKRYIAKHFNVSQERVRQWMISFFGSSYDPRPERKESILAGMIEFAINNSQRDFTYAFTGTQYYKEALEICKKRKIYEE